ncbi:MAG TPA: acyl-CoA carboxylase epsilon subunit [Pengzhenrongella sp.]
MTDGPADVDPPALVQVVRGEPDDVELAALVAGLAAAGGGPPDDAPAPSMWSDRSRALRGRTGPRTPLAPGLDAWRWSLRS